MRLRPLVRIADHNQSDHASGFRNTDATVHCLLRAVPAAVPGVAFLSRGQSGILASARLNAMNVRFKSRLPWALAFSYGRAIQKPVLEIWHGSQANAEEAQQALYHRATCDRAARLRNLCTSSESTA
jgi:fructose-bisphosphate aldolase class I